MFTLNHRYGATSPLPFNGLVRIASVAPDFSVLGRIVRAVAAWRARADAEARRAMFCLARLNDHTLRDIGLNRADFYREGMKPRCYDI